MIIVGLLCFCWCASVRALDMFKPPNLFYVFRPIWRLLVPQWCCSKSLPTPLDANCRLWCVKHIDRNGRHIVEAEVEDSVFLWCLWWLLQAALLAGRTNKALVGREEFSQAVLRSVAGIEKKRSILQGLEKDVVARHEVRATAAQ